MDDLLHFKSKTMQTVNYNFNYCRNLKFVGAHNSGIQPAKNGKCRLLRLILADGTGTLNAVFFEQSIVWFKPEKYQPGQVKKKILFVVKI